jgi:hypothetical protein
MAPPRWAHHEGDINLVTSRKPLAAPGYVWCCPQSLCLPRNIHLAKQVIEGCLICRRVNKQALRKQPSGGGLQA